MNWCTNEWDPGKALSGVAGGAAGSAPSHASARPRTTPPYLQRVDREGADGREVQDLEVVHVAVHDDSRQVEAAGGGGHADLAELVVQELAHDGTLAHASRP